MFHFIPFLRLRASEEAEIVGIDDSYLGEFTHDYIGLDPELRLHRVDDYDHDSQGHGKGTSLTAAPGGELTGDKVGNEKVGGGRVDV